MTHKLFVVIFFLIIGFSYIQNQPHSFKDLVSWTKNAKIQGMKEMKAAFSNEHPTNVKDSMFMEKDKDVPVEKLTQVVKSIKDQRKTKRFTREAVSKDVSVSPSVEIPKPTADSEGVQKTKRQTSISGNGNRLRNLINLPIQLNVLANVLSQLNSGVLDSPQNPLGSNTISGNDNTVSSLVNAPIDVNAVVNLLSNIDLTNPGSAGSTGGKGEVGGVLQSLLAGGGGAGEKGSGLLGSLLDDGSGLLGGVLGNTLGDLLQGLLGSDGLVANLLGGLDGKGLVAELLDNLLKGVVDLVDNLLNLLVGLLQALLQGTGDSKTGAANPATGDLKAAPQGNNNSALSLINAPIRLNALINILSSLKQELRPQANSPAANQGNNIQGNNNKVSSLINLPVNLDVNLNALSSLKQTSANNPNACGRGIHPAGAIQSGSSLPGTSMSGSSTASNPSRTSISGNNNALSSLVNVAPDVNLNLNVLSEVTDLLSGNAGGSQQGNNPNEICFDVPINQADTSVTGNNNRISSAVNVQPTINLDLNLLSSVQQSGSSNGPTQRVCIIRPTRPSTRPPMRTTSMPSSSNDICFDVLVDQSGNVVSGNNNQLTSLLNVNPNIDVGINLLSNVQQSNALAGFKVKRICLPKQSNTTPAMNFPPTPPPIRSPAQERCFRRTCTRWKQFVDTKCVNTANEYPKHTYTRDI